MNCSFDEFCSEVYRRRDETVKKRKRIRRTFLSLAIPVVLCSALLFLSPALRPANEKASRDEAISESLLPSEGALHEDFDELTAEITKITVLVGKEELAPRDREDASALIALLENAENVATDSGSNSPQSEISGGVLTTLLLEDALGETKKVSLWFGGTSYRIKAEGESYTLSQEDSQALKEILERCVKQ